MSDKELHERVRAESLFTVLFIFIAATLSAAPPAAAQTGARPGPSVVAGARKSPDVAFASRAGRRCDRYVSTEGDDARAGDEVRTAWKTIGKALRTLRAGEVGCVLPGTYEEGHNEAQNNGRADAPIVLRRAPGFAAMPVVKPKGPVAVFHIDRDYWVVDGFDIDVNFQKVTGFRFYDNADHGVLRNSRLHNSTSGSNVYVSGRDILIENCEIFNNFKTDEEDSHGVAIVPPASRVSVRRNRIWDNGGDGVQCEDYATAPVNPEDIIIEDNQIFTTPANYGRTENAVDIKSCKYITIRGSSPPSPSRPGAAKSRFYGFALKPTARGEGVVVHYNARHVLFENNVIQDVCRGLSVGRGEDKQTLVRELVVRRNIIENLRQGTNCDGNGILISRAEHLDVYGNVLRNIPRAGFRIGVNNSTGSPDRDVDFWGNTVGPAARWIDVAAEPGKLESFASDRNRFVESVGASEKFFVDGKPFGLDAWRRLAGSPSIQKADPGSNLRRE
jgi:hypothetical protein